MSREKVPALGHLHGVLVVLDKQGKHPAAETLATVRTMVQDAITVLKEPDPVKQHIAFVLLALKQSTEVTERVIRGKTIVRVKIVELELYHYAMSQIHKIATKL